MSHLHCVPPPSDSDESWAPPEGGHAAFGAPPARWVEPIHLKVVWGLGRGESVVSFDTGTSYADASGQPVLFGPGSIQNAHAAHESILKQDLIDPIDVYAGLVKSLLASAPPVAPPR